MRPINLNEETLIQDGAVQTHKLQSLHTILSTGSVLPARSFNYVYNEVKSDVQLVSISGGTDIMGCFVGPCPGLHPLPGEIPGPLLGMAIESWDEDGRRLFGESGELVCTQPFPSQPLYFWGDDLGKKYHQAYFSKFKGIWAHGDYCKINPESGGLVLLGRSDGTLNPNGVRFGSTEIYNIVEAFPEILDSLCVAQRGERGEERAVLFLKPSPGYKLNLELCTKLRQAIRNSLSPRHVPAVLLEIKDIPYTVSGKKVENAVRRVIEGEKPRLLGTLTNPESLSLFYNLPELQGY
uniref:Acetoacetyl-CoA synthetase n=1 Tax=Eptatretus burgeri TaxID=7764 RepID=A0A8C4QGV9_EPTBU